jgi:cytochrome b
MSEALFEPISVRIWDLPIRIVHWSFAILFCAMWWTAESRDMILHRQLGAVFLGLLCFRILWGFSGSSTARFSSFLKGPRTIKAYLKGDSEQKAVLGHNPLGGWSVVTILALIAVQIGFGLVAQDVDGLESGPLNHLVSYDAAESAREWHETLFNVLLGVVVFHVGAILFYLLGKKENLVPTMIVGTKVVETPTSVPQMGSWLATIMCTAVAALFTYWIWTGAPIPTFKMPIYHHPDEYSATPIDYEESLY